MLKKIGKACISLIVALLLALAAWYFLLIKLPEHQVMGTAAPTMSREQRQKLLRYHGVKVAYIKDGQWYFCRDGKDCRLIR